METALTTTPKRKLRTLLSDMLPALKFGDFILMQEYHQTRHDGQQYHYSPAKPVFGVVVGIQPCDQTIELEYVPSTRMNGLSAFAEVRTHAEWNNYADFLGHWETRPGWREILAAYRKQNTAESVASEEIDWSNY